MRKYLNKKKIKYKQVNSRIIIKGIELKRGEFINIKQIYGSVEGAKKRRNRRILCKPRKVLDEAREENETVIIMGDWNGRVEKTKIEATRK